jgi:hypothetical protein
MELKCELIVFVRRLHSVGVAAVAVAAAAVVS